MIRAQKGGLLGLFWKRYVRFAVRRAFRGVWVRGPAPVPRERLLFYASHPSWWDGFAFHELALALGLDPYCVMEERQLARFPFLRRLGAFSIRRGDARSALGTLRYAARLLDVPRAAVAIFPQGVMQPNVAPPLELERGVEVLARAAKAVCVPLAIRLVHLEDRRPDLLLELGPAHGPEALERFQLGLEGPVRSLATAGSLDGFSPLSSLAQT